MNQIFAPWRMEWVERDREYEGCVFCDLPEHDPDVDRENYLLARGEDVYLLLNNYPYNPGHAMVIPTAHTGKYEALSPSVLLEKERLIQLTIGAMEEALGADGYNVGYNLGEGAAGGSIPDHLHAHVIPRWEGDTNFMPVISETTVIVEAILDTYDRLHDALADQEGVIDEGPGAVELEPTEE